MPLFNSFGFETLLLDILDNFGLWVIVKNYMSSKTSQIMVVEIEKHNSRASV